MYEDTLLSLSRDTRFRSSEPLTDPLSDVRNPACGDEVALSADLSGDRIQNLRFYAQGCAVCVASAAAMCDVLSDCTLSEATRRIEAALAFFAGQAEWQEPWGTPSLPALGAVRTRPMRMSCVRMAWEGMQPLL